VYRQGTHSEKWESDRILPIPWNRVESILSAHSENDSENELKLTAVTHAALSCEKVRRQHINPNSNSNT